MKSCISTSIILNLLALSATTRAAGNWSIDEKSCGPTGAAFIIKEYDLVLRAAVRMSRNLYAPSQTTETLVQYMFGTAQQDYDPISFPQVVFGGGGTDNILGLANFAGSPTAEDELGDGDFVSCSPTVNVHSLLGATFCALPSTLGRRRNITPIRRQTRSEAKRRAGGGIESGAGAASSRMRELVLTMSEKIFCNLNHVYPPDVAKGQKYWYNSCKQVTFLP